MATRILQAMAFNRKTFKDKLQDILGAALTHYYMVKLAKLNGQTKWVQHWQSEVDRLVNMDTVRILVSQTKGRWDKWKALQESLADVEAADSGYRRVAANYIAKVYKLRKINWQLSPGAEIEFYTMVQEAAENALSSDGDQKGTREHEW